jgi:polyisoprenyl-teichoic acid--peptidoglycan teichoic acid transferase
MDNKQSNKPPKKRIRKITLIILSVLFVCALTSAIFVFTELSKMKKYEPGATIAPANEVFDTEDQEPINSSAPVINPNDVKWPTGIKPLRNQDYINILLIGQDRRPNQPRQRSDSMIILSYNMKQKTVKLISLMRDMYVQIPGYSDNRINAAYQFGGLDLLDMTILQNFGVGIDGNFAVDFDGFTKVVDTLGGIDINITAYDAAYLNKRTSTWNIHSGLNHLDGAQALDYSRIRYVGNADYERTERQRNVMNLIIDKILALSASDQLKMVDVLLPYLTTDMSKTKILSYCLTVMQNGINGVEKYRIPADGTYSSPVIRGMDVLLPDLEKNSDLIQKYLES